MRLRLWTLLLAFLPVVGQPVLPPNTLTAAERRDGWQLLFDGQSLNGWTWSVDTPQPLPSWEAVNGELRTTPGKGKQVYLLTRDSFSDYELVFEWKGGPGANSGVKYRFQGFWVDRKLAAEPSGPTRIEPVALEYQIIDDAAHPDALSDAKHTTAAIYEYWPANKAEPVLIGQWHTSRIVALGTRIEHWLDGKKVLDVDLSSPELQAAFQQSPRRRSSPALARHERRHSPIALQFHDGLVAFRNLKIRKLSTLDSASKLR